MAACHLCYGTKQIRCTTCHGAQRTRGDQVCAACGGIGSLTCPSCLGNARPSQLNWTYGVPWWARRWTRSRPRRPLRSDQPAMMDVETFKAVIGCFFWLAILGVCALSVWKPWR
jgi:hypothetical protein